MREIHVDISLVKERYNHFFKECASTGRAYLILRSDHQQHLEMAAQECGFKYLRFHGLLQDDMGVYREDTEGNPIYSWQYADAVYDFLLGIGMRPFVVFDFMPEKLASGNKTVYWEKANVTPPKDYDKWSALVGKVVEHFTERYGQEEVKQWFFEVWNEPDNGYFFTAGMDEYFTLYESTARAVKGVCAEYRVGGPAIAGDTRWVGGLIDFCRRSGAPIDFISMHTYATKNFCEHTQEDKLNHISRGPAGIPVWSPGTPWTMGNQRYDPEGAAGAVCKARQAVGEASAPELDIHCTEWGLTWDYWDPLRDSYHAASFILSRLKSVWGSVKSMSYCEISDVFEEDGPPTGHFHGGFGLINLQGIRKPAYFAYKFLNQLGETELKCDDANAIACSENGGVQVLFWDCTVRQDKENKEYYNKDNLPLPAGNVRLSIAGLLTGDYEVAVYCTGYRQNDAYTSYMEMKPSGSLSREAVKLLDGMSRGIPVKSDRIAIDLNSGGTYVFETDMRENDVFLVMIQRMEEKI